MKPVACGLLVLLVGLLSAGCGSGRLKPHGRLLKDGAPYLPGPDEVVHISFVPAGEGAAEAAAPATFNRDHGTFQVVGAQGQGVSPGRYRVCVQVIKKKKDLLRGAFGAAKSPFVRDVTRNSGDLTLDLAKPNE
jgi:hypothetical protein